MTHYNEYVDNRGWHYQAISMIGGEPYAICYQKKPGGGWHRMKHLMVRTTLTEAQKDLDKICSPKRLDGHCQ